MESRAQGCVDISSSEAQKKSKCGKILLTKKVKFVPHAALSGIPTEVMTI